MSVIEKIKARTSNVLFEESEVSREVITKILDTAVCTPVHYNTDPWRFVVLQGESRVRFGEFLAERAVKEMEDPADALNITKLTRIKNKPLRAPVIIVAGAAKSTNPKALMAEDIASVASGCQNMLLAADELGLATIWRTGAIAYTDDVVDYLGFEKNTRLVAFIYSGKPSRKSKSKIRKTSSEFTRWIN